MSNPNAEVFAALMSPIAYIGSVRWWHVALAVIVPVALFALAVYGLLHLVGLV